MNIGTTIVTKLSRINMLCSAFQMTAQFKNKSFSVKANLFLGSQYNFLFFPPENMAPFNIPAYTTYFIEQFNQMGGQNGNTPYYEQAVYFAMEEVRRTNGVTQLRVGRHDFYYLPEIELGLFLRLCRYSTEQGVTNRIVHPHDLTNGLLATSTITVQAACGAFLRAHPNATLACGIGSRRHEQAMFIKNVGRNKKKHMRVYNCKWNTSSVALVARFRRLCNVDTFVYHSALHRRQNNSELGICGALSWCEIVLHFKAGVSPFSRNVALFDLRNHDRRLN